MTRDEHDALRAQTVADMHDMARPVAMRYATVTEDHAALGAGYAARFWSGPGSWPSRPWFSLVQEWPFPDLPPEGVSIVGYDRDEHRPAAIDDEGRRWLLDGSGDVA